MQESEMDAFFAQQVFPLFPFLTQVLEGLEANPNIGFINSDELQVGFNGRIMACYSDGKTMIHTLSYAHSGATLIRSVGANRTDYEYSQLFVAQKEEGCFRVTEVPMGDSITQAIGGDISAASVTHWKFGQSFCHHTLECGIETPDFLVVCTGKTYRAIDPSKRFADEGSWHNIAVYPGSSFAFVHGVMRGVNTSARTVVAETAEVA